MSRPRPLFFKLAQTGVWLIGSRLSLCLLTQCLPLLSASRVLCCPSSSSSSSSSFPIKSLILCSSTSHTRRRQTQPLYYDIRSPSSPSFGPFVTAHSPLHHHLPHNATRLNHTQTIDGCHPHSHGGETIAIVIPISYRTDRFFCRCFIIHFIVGAPRLARSSSRHSTSAIVCAGLGSSRTAPGSMLHQS